MTTRNRKAKAETKEQTRETLPPSLIAYHVTNRGESNYWTRIGAAWDHDDAKGLTVQLDLVPATGGRIVLREPSADTEAAEQA